MEKEKEKNWKIEISNEKTSLFRRIEKEKALELIPVVVRGEQNQMFDEDASNKELIKDPRIRDLLIHYYRNAMEHLKEQCPERFGDIHNDFNDFEKGLCSVCPFEYDSHSMNCLECCPVNRTKEEILQSREKEWISETGGMTDLSRFNFDCTFQPIDPDDYVGVGDYLEKDSDPYEKTSKKITEQIAKEIQQEATEIIETGFSCPNCDSDDVKLEDHQSMELRCRECDLKFSLGLDFIQENYQVKEIRGDPFSAEVEREDKE